MIVAELLSRLLYAAAGIRGVLKIVSTCGSQVGRVYSLEIRNFRNKHVSGKDTKETYPKYIQPKDIYSNWTSW